MLNTVLKPRGSTVLIVEDEAVVALDIQRRLKNLGYGLSVIRNSYSDAVNYISIHKPILILCDISLTGGNDGIDIAEYVHVNESIPLIFVTAHSDHVTLDRAKKTLPYGYIVKPFTDRDLSTALELALYRFKSDLNRLKLSLVKVNQISNKDLTEREYCILEEVISGKTNAQIAQNQFISLSTVKFHISNLLLKLEVQNRSSLARRILELFT